MRAQSRGKSLAACHPSAVRSLRERDVFDFDPLIDANTEMTAPFADPAFFNSHYIELGALAWPNDFDLSAPSLHSQLEQAGLLQRSAAAG